MSRERLKRIILIAVISIMAVFISGCASKEVEHIVTIDSLGGEISILRGKKLEVSEGMLLSAWDRIEVGEGSYLKLHGDSDKHIDFSEKTSFVLRSIGNDESGNIVIDLAYGEALCTKDNNLSSSGIDIKTPNASLSLRGSSFLAAYNADKKVTTVEALEGKVCVSYSEEIVFLEDGEGAEIKKAEDKIDFVKYNLSDNDTDKESGKNTPSNTNEKLFGITMVYPENDKNGITTTEFTAEVTSFSKSKGGMSNNDIVLQKYIGIIKGHSDEIVQYYTANKSGASENENKDITEWFTEETALGNKTIIIDKAVMSIAADEKSVTFEFYGDFKADSASTTLPPVSDEDEAENMPDETHNPATTKAPVTTPKQTTPKVTTTGKKETESGNTTKSNSIKMEEVVSGRIVYVNIPSGYKLWEYDAADYKKEGKLYGALLVPTKKGKYNISISFESGDPMKTLVKSGKTNYDGSSYKVIDEYKCTINKSKTGTAYIAELDGAKEYMVFIECVSGEDAYLVIQLEDSDENTVPIKTSNLNSSTKDIKKFAREMFPAAR